MSNAAGFDFNQWQQLQRPQHSGPGDAATLDSTTQDGVDNLVQSAGKLLGVNTDLKGHGVVAEETNVGSGLSLQHGAFLKERPGGVLASLFKYFTRDIPNLFGGGESLADVAISPEGAGPGGTVGAGAHLDAFGEPGYGSEPSLLTLPGSAIAVVQECGIALRSLEPSPASWSSLGDLTPSPGPSKGRTAEVGIAA